MVLIKKYRSILAVDVAANACWPNNCPTHMELMNPLRDCSAFPNMMGMENVNSVLLTGPFVSGDGLLFPSRTSWDGISRLRALENPVRLSERRLPSEEAMVPPLK
ncbi:MAG: hypothetical protein AB2404_02455 [Planifilum fimeticola]